MDIFILAQKSPDILDEGGYFDYPMDSTEDLRPETILTLESMGIKVEYSHHEVTPSQHEIDLRYVDPLKMADMVMIYRVSVKEIARNAVYTFHFMPKSLFGKNGSRMHTNQSLFKGEQNASFDSINTTYLITLVLNQWVNSYKKSYPWL